MWGIAAIAEATITNDLTGFERVALRSIGCGGTEVLGHVGRGIEPGGERWRGGGVPLCCGCVVICRCSCCSCNCTATTAATAATTAGPDMHVV